MFKLAPKNGFSRVSLIRERKARRAAREENNFEPSTFHADPSSDTTARPLSINFVPDNALDKYHKILLHLLARFPRYH